MRNARGLMARLAGRRGNAVVELSLVFILFFLTIGMLIQGAWLFHVWITLTNAVREGARYGAVCWGRYLQACDQTAIVDFVRRTNPWNIWLVDPNQVQVTVSQQGDLLVVRATYEVPLIMGFAGWILPERMPIWAESAMRLENQPVAVPPTPTPTPTPKKQ